MLEAPLITPQHVREIERETQGALGSDERLQDVCDRIRRRMGFVNDEMGQPTLTVCIPAHNEEGNITGTLSAVSRLELPQDHRTEVLVIDNASTDRTKQIARECGVRVVSEKQAGLPYARQAGINEAKGKIICWTEADSLPVTTWLTQISSHFKDPNVVGAFGRVVFHNIKNSYVAYRKLMDFLKSLLLPGSEQKKTTKQRPAGANFAYRVEAAIKAGGYPEQIHFGEDFWMGMQLEVQGNLVADNSDKAVVYSDGRRENDILSITKDLRGMVKNRLSLSSSIGGLTLVHPDLGNDEAVREKILEMNTNAELLRYAQQTARIK